MSVKGQALHAIQRLPDDTDYPAIADEIALLAGIETAREQARRGEGIPAEQAHLRVETWTGW